MWHAGLSGATWSATKFCPATPRGSRAVRACRELACLGPNPQQIPANIAGAFAARFSALRKFAGGMRGIATGDTFRQLVWRCVARQFADRFDEATRPYQFALQTRAGTDALPGMLRAAVDLDADATIVSLDGRSAYDTISRAAFMSKLREVERLQPEPG